MEKIVKYLGKYGWYYLVLDPNFKLLPEIMQRPIEANTSLCPIHVGVAILEKKQKHVTKRN